MYFCGARQTGVVKIDLIIGTDHELSADYKRGSLVITVPLGTERFHLQNTFFIIIRASFY